MTIFEQGTKLTRLRSTTSQPFRDLWRLEQIQDRTRAVRTASRRLMAEITSTSRHLSGMMSLAPGSLKSRSLRGVADFSVLPPPCGRWGCSCSFPRPIWACKARACECTFRGEPARRVACLALSSSHGPCARSSGTQSIAVGLFFASALAAHDS